MAIDRSRRESGSILATILPLSIVLFAMVAGMLSLSVSTRGEQQTSRQHIQRLYLAEAGVAHAVVEITGGGDGNLGTVSAPIEAKGGAYRVTARKLDDESFIVTSVGIAGSHSRTLRAVLRSRPSSAFNNAMFAGNEDDDPSYTLAFGGTDASADVINGGVYSGGDISVKGDATISGTVHAAGTVTGIYGESGADPQQIPDLSASHYHTSSDVKVAQEFAAGATYESSALGGDAWQLAEENPAHIFRMNPSDRLSEYLSTEKDDFFLEDPYHPVVSGTALDLSGSSEITLSGMGGNPGDLGNRKVYFIDGNLWVHNRKIFSFMITGGGEEGTQALFVVKGNIYFSDNILRQDPERDGFGFIALEDEGVPDSGNIYFGDPTFGTLEQMDGFMYAENNFHEKNLNASGSEVVVVNGIMSAGNQVLIHRNDEGTRTRLIANFDSRLESGELEIPGIPKNTIEGKPVYHVVSSTEVIRSPEELAAIDAEVVAE